MMLLALLLLAAGPGDFPGLFHHGQWRGTCFRDGTLRGQDDELCRGDWQGNTKIGFERNADRLLVLLSPKGPYRQECVAAVHWSERRARRRDRVPALISAVNSAARAVPTRCGMPRVLPINARDLAKTLRDTDGLTHVLR